MRQTSPLGAPVRGARSRSPLVAIVAAAVASALVTSAVFLFVVLPTLTNTPPAQKPVVGFGAPTLTAGVATFSVSSANPEYNFSRYFVFLLVDGDMGSSGLSTAMTFAINGTTYRIALADPTGSGSLRTGEAFTAMTATSAPLPGGHFWTFLLEWRYDGTFVASARWRT